MPRGIHQCRNVPPHRPQTDKGTSVSKDQDMEVGELTIYSGECSLGVREDHKLSVSDAH